MLNCNRTLDQGAGSQLDNLRGSDEASKSVEVQLEHNGAGGSEGTLLAPQISQTCRAGLQYFC